ncbi:YegP family protein [Arthrobacter sp. UC242_113]|uniref:YegP family protein n=1 Tax=Arthrobacter sp. UC242_113 TaxID=3374550 RepID=UPI003756AF73
MAGMFELFIDAEDSFRFQLTAPDGTVMAVSRPFPSKAAAVEGIAAVREYAGMGHVKELAKAPVDRSLGSRPHAAVRPHSVRMPLLCQRMAG